MRGKLEEIEGIEILGKHHPPPTDQSKSEDRLEIRDRILEKIRDIAGKNSIKRVVPIQNQGDHKTQEVVFEVDNTEYMARLRYNNALTEGSVEEVGKVAKKC